MFTINGELYSEEELIYIINFYKKHHKFSLLNDDILRIIMLHLDIKTLNYFCQTHTRIYSIFNQNSFWEDKFKTNHRLVWENCFQITDRFGEYDTLSFTNSESAKLWLKKYQNIHKNLITASDLTEVLILLSLDRNSSKVYVGDTGFDLKKLYWLPVKLLTDFENAKCEKKFIDATQKVENYSKEISNIYFNVKKFGRSNSYDFIICIDIAFYYDINNVDWRTIKSHVTKHDFINSLTTLLYMYPNVSLDDKHEVPFLYDHLVTINSPEAIYRKRFWDDYLKSKKLKK